MSSLALAMLEVGSEEFGLWMFLSVGAVALFVVFLPLTSWIDSQRKEREAFYRAETMRRIVESSGQGAMAPIELMREQSRQEQAKKREGMMVGGLINIAVGTALMVFLHALIANRPIYLCGLIPGMIGLALVTYALILAPKAE
jgi:hypothetical protein